MSDKIESIPVPDPGTGEFVVLPSVEALCAWMKANNLKFHHWQGSLLVVAPAAAESVESQEEKENIS